MTRLMTIRLRLRSLLGKRVNVAFVGVAEQERA